MRLSNSKYMYRTLIRFYKYHRKTIVLLVRVIRYSYLIHEYSGSASDCLLRIVCDDDGIGEDVFGTVVLME